MASIWRGVLVLLDLIPICRIATDNLSKPDIQV